jgi:peptidoglycan DL-endopeptidase CwlO
VPDRQPRCQDADAVKRCRFKGFTAFGVIVVSSLLASACASTGAVPRPFPTPDSAGTRGTSPVVPTLPAAKLVETALALLGAPYRNGGATPDGFDCSGFTQWVFARHGVSLPRETREQYAEGTSIKRHQLLAGDLLFFSTVAPGASHVAIALDTERFVHAPSSKGVVRIEQLSSSYWQRRYVGARRVGAR